MERMNTKIATLRNQVAEKIDRRHSVNCPLSVKSSLSCYFKVIKLLLTTYSMFVMIRAFHVHTMLRINYFLIKFILRLAVKQRRSERRKKL